MALALISQSYSLLLGRFLYIPHPFATDVLLHPFDLHVLSIPPAFNLSHDQTLQFNCMRTLFKMGCLIFLVNEISRRLN